MRLLSTSAARGIAVLALGLLVAAFLDAEGLRKQAEIQPQGFQRHLALDATRPLVAVSRALHLSTPRHELQVAIGREGEDVVDTRVELPPPAGPLPASTPKPRPAGKPGTAPKPKPTAKPKPKPVFTAADPLKLWVAGDSLAQVPGEGLERLPLRSLDILPVESRLSTGLARPDLYNWFTRLQSVIATLHPRVAVLSFGAILGFGGKLFAMPWSAITVDEARQRFLVNVTKDQLVNMPGFDKDHWPDLSDLDYANGVYRQWGVTPYWS